MNLIVLFFQKEPTKYKHLANLLKNKLTKHRYTWNERWHSNKSDRGN